MDAPQLVVIGTPSIDRIEIRDESLPAIGGSGFITAVAARLASISTGLVARVPKRLPDGIAAAFYPGCVDPGGLTVVDGPLPGFHISYDEAERATYLTIEPGEEADVRGADLPRRWLDAAWIHIGPLAASTRIQIRFLEQLLARDYRGGLSAGTFGRAAATEPELVRDLFARVDVAFLNREEAGQIYPDNMPVGRIICVTDGSAGARRWDGSEWTNHPTKPTTAVDPTGAGDAFIGGYLGAMLAGDADPVDHGLHTAAQVIKGPGAAPLIDQLRRHVEVVPDPRPTNERVAVVDTARTADIAAVLGNVAAASALDFCGSPFPEDGNPVAIEILTVATLHQYGFWRGTDRGYGGPMWATIDGIRRKGSDFIWHAFTRAAANDPTVLHHRRLAGEPLLFDAICTDDDGACPIPDVGSHRVLQQAYAAFIGGRGGMRSLIDRANEAADPLAALLDSLSRTPGFGEDPLAKKANLLALILASRPERFLDLRGPTKIAPIVDYHIMRTMLRTGCVHIVDADRRTLLADRAWIDAASEIGIRLAARDAILELCWRAGLDVASVDGFLFSLGRSLCLETEPPKCEVCSLEPACARDIDLFQPIVRTTAY
jgi:sugar/nucleoside kinase (ribokinase family)